MKQIADMDAVKELLKSEAGYRIAKDTGISQSTISRFQTGESNIENMRFSHAITLTNYFHKKNSEQK
ncbi:DNA-binding protein [Dolosicoccus paucivorans]|uniref:DNA-binding protein n=1 Tax=Dolosicoccus paucivorans TaxID=84521 RepID=A0A2N6SMD7_9LACT|nr:DNA-binding protein [Dolosicoccus paucivorans]PMB84616.1 DNA-binding protein [Dolosicoccus paucivorans]PMC58232.1 DNA-binding protein [Dolosicoccus paucivorans]